MMSFLAGSVSTLAALVVILAVWVGVTQPKARAGLGVLAALIATHVLAFTFGVWVGRL